MNGEIRTLVFAQGVGIAVAPTAGDIGKKVTLANNADTVITDLAWDITSVRFAFIDYTIYRRVNGSYKILSGKIHMIGCPDGATNADKWTFEEMNRVEKFADSGITFSLTSVGVAKSALKASLDNFAGVGHDAIMFYRVSTISA